MSSIQQENGKYFLADTLNQSIYEKCCQCLQIINHQQPENVDEILQEILSKLQQKQCNQKQENREINSSRNFISSIQYVNQCENVKDLDFQNTQISQTQKLIKQFLQQNNNDQRIPNLEIFILLIISLFNQQDNVNSIQNTLQNNNIICNKIHNNQIDIFQSELEKLQQIIVQKEIEIINLNKKIQLIINQQESQKFDQVQQDYHLFDQHLNKIVNYIESISKSEQYLKNEGNNKLENLEEKIEFVSFGFIEDQEPKIDMIEKKCSLIKQKIELLLNNKVREISNLQKEIDVFNRSSDSNLSSISASSYSRSESRSILRIPSIPSQQKNLKKKCVKYQHQRAHTVEIINGEIINQNSSKGKINSSIWSDQNISSRQERLQKKVSYPLNLLQKKQKKNGSCQDLKSASPSDARRLKKMSSFYRNLQKEQSDEQSSENEKQITTTDFLGIRNDPTILKIMKKKNTEQNKEEEEVFFSDQASKLSHSRQKQERIICLDQTNFYVINSNQTTSDGYKKFPIREINKIILSSKNPQLCSLHIKKEFELIIEIQHREALISQIEYVFKNIFKMSPPIIQTSKNDRQPKSQSGVNRLKIAILNHQKQNIDASPQSQTIEENNSIQNIDLHTVSANQSQDDISTPKFTDAQVKHSSQGMSQEHKRQVFKVLIQKNNGFLKRLFGEQWQQGSLQIDGNQIQINDCDINSDNNIRPITIISLDKNLINTQQIFHFIDSQNNKYLIKLQESFDSPLLITKLNNLCQRQQFA